MSVNGRRPARQPIDELLQSRLRMVWQHAGDQSFRYVPKPNQGGGWAVWDRKAKRFLSSPELRKVPRKAIRDELFHDG